MTKSSTERERKSYVKPAIKLAKRYAVQLVVPETDRHLKSIEDLTDAGDVYAYDCSPPPITMLLITLCQLGVFIYYAVQFGYVTKSGPIPFESAFVYDPKRRYEVWRYVTYMFIHAGGVHIFFNMLIQLMLGIPLELVHKYWRVLLIYMSGVLAGSLGTSISDPTFFLVGASGGVYALITGHLATIIMNFKDMSWAVYQLIGFLAFIAIDFGMAIYNRYWTGKVDNIGYSAHLAGAMAGLLVGIVVLKNVKKVRWEQLLWWISLLTFIILIVVMIIWNLAYQSYFPHSKWD